MVQFALYASIQHTKASQHSYLQTIAKILILFYLSKDGLPIPSLYENMKYYISSPEIGPATKMPSRTPNPQPMLMESISPLALLLRMDWATHPQPNISSTIVPSSSAQNSFAIFACSCFLKIFFPPAPIGTGFPPTGMITDIISVILY